LPRLTTARGDGKEIRLPRNRRRTYAATLQLIEPEATTSWRMKHFGHRFSHRAAQTAHRSLDLLGVSIRVFCLAVVAPRLSGPLAVQFTQKRLRAATRSPQSSERGAWRGVGTSCGSRCTDGFTHRRGLYRFHWLQGFYFTFTIDVGLKGLHARVQYSALFF
jgi:hypothetical protein